MNIAIGMMYHWDSDSHKMTEKSQTALAFKMRKTLVDFMHELKRVPKYKLIAEYSQDEGLVGKMRTHSFKHAMQMLKKYFHESRL